MWLLKGSPLIFGHHSKVKLITIQPRTHSTSGDVIKLPLDVCVGSELASVSRDVAIFILILVLDLVSTFVQAQQGSRIMRKI